jgi:chitin disaccharide deacetylase
MKKNTARQFDHTAVDREAGVGKPGKGCRLIINGDDFGWSEGANEAVALLYDRGILTSASLMVGGPAARGAMQIAHARAGLAVGLHLALVQSCPVLRAVELPTILDRDGCLPLRHARAGVMVSLSGAWRREMRREMEAQFKAFAATGLEWSHVDGHVHFTLTPWVFRQAVELAEEYGVPGFRVPQDDFAFYRRFDPADAARQHWLARWFDLQCGGQRRYLRDRPFCTTARCYGLFRSGRIDVDYLLRLVEALPDGDLELHCHPDLGTETGRREVEALVCSEFKDALAARGVQLATYRSLTADCRAPLPTDLS